MYCRRFRKSALRITQYAQITLAALKDFEDRGFDHLKPAQWSIDDPDSMAQVLVALNRKSQVDFLKEEGQDAEPHIFEQAAVSLWGALEVFVDDLVLAVLKHDPSRIGAVPAKIKIPLADFYRLDEDKKLAEVVRVVSQELGTTLKSNVGAFETILKAFSLGGEVETLTKVTIVEFVAVRNCIVHRKGIVDAKFKEVCSTSKLNIGDRIRVTAQEVDRYLYAAAQYAATVIDRVKAQFAPDVEIDMMTATWLERLKQAASSATA